MEVIVKVKDSQEEKESSFLSLSCGYSDIKPASIELILKEEEVAEDRDAALLQACQQVAMVKMEEFEEHEDGCRRQDADSGETPCRVCFPPLHLSDSLSGCGQRQPLPPHQCSPATTTASSLSNHLRTSHTAERPPFSQATALRVDYGARERLLPVSWDLREESRRPDLMDKLQDRSRHRNKMNAATEEEEHHHRRMSTLLGNKNAAKHTRLIEFGWMHNGRQVRSRNGGGTRRLVMPKNASYHDLFQLGKEMFFPEGISTKGPETDFLFQIRDYSGTQMPRDATVGALYEPLKHGMLRLYLCSGDRSELEPESELRLESGSESCGSEHVSSPSRPQLGPPPRSTSTSSLSSDVNCVASSDLAHEVLGYPEESYHFAALASPPSFRSGHDHAPLELNSCDSQAPKLLCDTQESRVPALEAPSQPKRSRWEPSCPSSTSRTLRLRRVNIARDMIKQFQDPSMMDAALSVSFVVGESAADASRLASASVNLADESGVNAPGQASPREAYSRFWAVFLQADAAAAAAAASGETTMRTPSLLPDRGKAEWEAAGRILLKGYRDVGYFPTRLPLAFAVCLVHGEEALTPEMLIKSFLRSTGAAERDILCAALEGSTYEIDGLLDVLHRMCVRTLPDGGNIEDVVVRIAHAQLIQGPMYPLVRMASTAQKGLRQLLPTVAAVTALYDT
ncbi:uncharacterized protein LOC143136607 isoform X1 [Alosa pseudoharengus]|uniref:uncharacterized protein LOC143136607 isoform X1 n=1 Tax=Alosa pseudoharengus TaxID=34774 RepID=UPI003F888FD7